MTGFGVNNIKKKKIINMCVINLINFGTVMIKINKRKRKSLL
jgi:hypothetical protein